MLQGGENLPSFYGLEILTVLVKASPEPAQMEAPRGSSLTLWAQPATGEGIAGPNHAECLGSKNKRAEALGYHSISPPQQVTDGLGGLVKSRRMGPSIEVLTHRIWGRGAYIELPLW